MTDKPGGSAQGGDEDGSWGKASTAITVITGLIALLAFFGIANWSDLKDWLSGGHSGSTATPDPRPVAGEEVTTTPRKPYRPTTTDRPPPPATVGDCIAVSNSGDFLGIGNCDGSQGTYLVKSATYRERCADPESPSITVQGYVLCLQLHLVENYCYAIPQGQGWVTGASGCREPGTVIVVDVVRGATTDANCTREYQWNRWYSFTKPQVVYCVMAY